MAQPMPAAPPVACGPAGAARWAVVATRVAAHLDELDLHQLAILRLCDGLRDLESICRYTGLTPAEAYHVLEELEAGGFVAVTRHVPCVAPTPPQIIAWIAGTPPTPVSTPAVAAAAPAPAAAEPAFSADEEAFFAAGDALGGALADAPTDDDLAA